MTTHPTTLPLLRATMLALPMLWAAGCAGLLPGDATAQLTPVGAPDESQFEQSIANYPYHASPQRSKKIRRGLARVKRCMTKSQIRALLGAPDAGRQTYGPKGPDETWQGSSWSYYLFKKDNPGSLDDQSVEVFFDTHDRADWIVSIHIKNANDIGSPTAKCPPPGRTH